MRICGIILIITVIMGIAGFWKKRIYFVIPASVILCFAAAAQSEYSAGSEAITYVEKNQEGEGSVEKELIAETEAEGQTKIQITVPEQEYTDSEADEIFNSEIEYLDQTLAGENNSLDNVCINLELSDAGLNGNIFISWSSSRPDIINKNGEIQENISEDGESVVLSAEFTLGDREREHSWKITVFPKTGSDGFIESVRKAIDEANKDNESDEYILPENINGENIIWHESPENTAPITAGIILLIGILLWVNEKQKEEEKKKKRNEKLKTEYPELVSRLLLMLYSGTGIRKAFFKTAAFYDKGKAENKENSEIYEEIVTVCREMDNGMTEDEAYERMADRCPLPCYRNLSVLLIQNRKRGGKGLMNSLEQEVITAFGEKKRQAEIAGDTATLKLLIPLGMMLMIVLALMLIPAFLSL